MGPRAQHASSGFTNSYDGFENAPNDNQIVVPRTRNRSDRAPRYSPTPSLKRGKVERLLKEHGSPPGMRVTAGGRVVPDGFTLANNNNMVSHPPLDLSTVHGSPRFPGVPLLHPDTLPSLDCLHQLNGWLVDLLQGALCQVVDGHLVIVRMADGLLSIRPPVVNLNHVMLQSVPGLGLAVFGDAWPSMVESGYATNGTPSSDPDEMTRHQLKVMKDFYDKLNRDYRALDRNEVLQRNVLTPANHAEIARQRKELTERIDQCRRGIKEMEKRLEAATLNANSQGIQPVHAVSTPFNMSQPMYQEQVNPNAPTPAPYFFQPVPQFQAMQSVQPMQQHFAGNQFPHQPEFSQQGFAESQFPQQSQVHPVHGNIPSGFIPVKHTPYVHHSFKPHPKNFPFTPVRKCGGFLASKLQQRKTDSRVRFNSPLGNISNVSRDTVKPSQTSSAAKNLNLDGATSQPRRSHAIEIKNPNQQASQKSDLNPTSPSYLPTNLASKDLEKPGNGRPLFYLLAAIAANKILTLYGLGNPLKDDGDSTTSKNPNESTGSQATGEKAAVAYAASLKHQPSSVTTTDFFPQDASNYSHKKWSEPGDENVNTSHPAWNGMTGGTDSTEDHNTPARGPPNKFLFNTESPEDGAFVNPPNTEDRPLTAFRQIRPAHDQSKQFSTQRPLDLMNVEFVGRNTQIRTHPRSEAHHSRHYDAHSLQTPTHSAGGSGGTITLSRAQLDQLLKLPPSKTGSYMTGWQIGVSGQHLSDDIDDADMRRGYRDGCFEEGFSPIEPAPGTQKTRAPGFGPSESSRRVPHPGSVPSVSRAVSVPSFQKRGKTTESAHEAAQAFTSALNNNYTMMQARARREEMQAATSGRQVGTQTSNNNLHWGEPVSPLAKRYSGNQLHNSVNENKCRVFSSPAYNSRSFDQQRWLAKPQTSVASSHGQAKGWFPQYDGSAEDDEPLAGKSENPSATVAPLDKGKARVKAPGSPVKRASSAVQNLLQIKSRRDKHQAGEESSDVETVAAVSSKSSPKKKEDDPAKLPSPEKARWRAMWRRRFDDLKHQEQAELDEYNRVFPASAGK